MRVVLLLVLLLVVQSADYCQNVVDQTNFYVTPQETRLLWLNSYIKGYNLRYQIDDASSAKLYSSFAIADKQQLGLKDYKAFKSADVRKSPKANGMGYGALLAQTEDDKGIAVWIGKFDGYNKLPNLADWKFLALPAGVVANCFDLKVADDEGKWAALNCQTVPQNEGESPQDMLCSISQDDQQLSLKNCNMFSTPFATRSRKSAIFKTSGKTYLLSANTDLTSKKVSVSYISVFYFNSDNKFVFSTIIDGTSLDKTGIQIAGFTIGGDNSIIVADSLESRLIFFNYTTPGDVTVSKVVDYQGRPLALDYNAGSDTLLVATKDVINEHSYQSLGTIVNKYEVDSSDSLITSLSSSKSLVSFVTQNKNLYIYERNQHKISYLLTKIQIVDETKYILSQQNSYVFSFNQMLAQSAYVAQPYLQISKLDMDKQVKVTATSETQTCVLQLNLKAVEGGNNIINKVPLEGKSFKVDSVSGLNIQLDNYFGGSDLQYNLPEQANKDFTFDIKHLSNYPFTASFPKAEATTILQLTPTSFYYIGVNTIQQYYTYIDICTLQGDKITCQFYAKVESISKTKKTVEAITAFRRANGKSIVMWSYKYSGRAEWIYIERKGVGFTDHSYPLAYSSLHISDNYFLAVSKTGRYISILFEEQPYYTGISEDNFNAEQLVELEYFYPREVYIDRSNANIFFVKLPTKIAKFHILDNHNVEYLGIVKSYGEYKLDSEWSINMDSNNIITYRDNTITEEYYNNVDLKFEKTNSITYTVASDPIQFDAKSENSFIVSKSNPDGEKVVKIMKPFNGVVDAEYADLIVKGDVAISQNWLLVDSDTPSVYFVDKHPTLTVKSNIPEDTFKEDVTLTIQIKSRTQTEKSTTEIEGVNYPVSIKNLPNSTIVTMPFSAKSVEIKLPVDKYFSGPISYYSLSCPMCGGSRIHLYGPLVANKSITTLPAIVDFINIGDGKVVALSFNTLNLLNNKQEVIKTTPIPKVTCTNLEYNSNINIGLLVFCTSETGEQILKYSILDNEFIFVTQYVFQAENKIRNFDEMFAVNRGDKNFLFVLDNDETVDSNKKQSTIKMFDLTDDFTYVGQWNSKLFGTDQIYPINDFQIVDSAVFVTIGNYGIGYGTIDNDGNLKDAGSIQLATIPDVKAALLDDSFFKQIEVISNKDTADEVKIFLTTTNSLNMVISLALKDKVYSYKALKESYYRYGNERLLNWHAITKDAIYLSYYNADFETVNLVYYKRAENVRTHFTDGALIRVSKNQIKYHEAILVNSRLITSHVGDVPSEGELSVYDTYNDFVLWIDYEEAGKFDAIEIQAFNDYKQSSHIQPVKFDGPAPTPTPEPDGLKWYIILIVALAVLIAVGVAYGMFIYMKKKRAEKSVSLLTQKEEDGEDEAEQNKKTLNQSTTYDGMNRTSINAAD